MIIPQDLKSYAFVLAMFGFSFGIIAGVLGAVVQILEGQLIGALAILFLSPIFSALFHVVVGVVTFPIYKIIVSRISRHEKTQ